MRNRANPILVAAVLVCLLPAVGEAALTQYEQNFELLVQTDPFALGNDGWLVYGNVFEPDGVTYIRGYGPFPAPNDGFAFCQIDLLQGGEEQGLQQLVVFSDYNNFDDHNALNVIESNVYQEQTIAVGDVNQLWTFGFQAKGGNIELASTARAFIKVLDPSSGYALTRYLWLDMTSIPETWAYYSIQIYVTPSLQGQILQFGFLNTATNFEGSGIFYDNLLFARDTSVDAPPGTFARKATLAQNYPNPFNPSTRIDFTLDRPGHVELSIYDTSGRKIATLREGNLGEGDHHVVWDGRTDGGVPVASGRYDYVLATEDGRVSRSMILLK